MLPWDFGNAVASTLGRRLVGMGFEPLTVADTRVVYSDGHRSVALAYLLEELPKPWLSVTVGLLEASIDKAQFVALWRAYPQVTALQNLDGASFDSEESLLSLLEMIVDTWLPNYILPLLEDEARLRALLAEQEQQLVAEQSQLADAQQLRRARQLFEAGDFRNAVLQYGLYGPERLSAADRRRLIIARRSAGRGSAE
jgi:hypothetical protein